MLLRLWREERASAAVEFALVLPLLLVLTLGLVDTVRYLLVLDKVHRVANSSADLVARYDKLTHDSLHLVLDAVIDIAEPVDITAAGGVIVTGVVRMDDAGGRRVAWQAKQPADIGASSSVGVPDGAATLPGDFILRNGETAIFAEAFYTFEPYVFSALFLGIGPRFVRVQDTAVYRPRLGTLSTIN